jgi:predicted esterase
MISEHHIGVRRTARYFTLGAVSPDVRELWIVCHGYGQLAASFLRSFAPIAAPSRLIVAPEALSRFYLDRTLGATDPPPRVGATWMTREDREHEIADQVAYLDALHDVLCSALTGTAERDDGTRVRLRVLGFSQGVATVGRWVAYGRPRPDELILWAGAFPPEVDLAALATRLEGTAVTLVVGARDELASWANADSHLRRLTDAGIAARLVTFGGGHRLDAGTLASLTGATIEPPHLPGQI